MLDKKKIILIERILEMMHPVQHIKDEGFGKKNKTAEINIFYWSNIKKKLL